MNLSEILPSLRNSWKKKKRFGTQPDSWTPPKGNPRLVIKCLVYVYQFLTSNSNFKTIIKSSKFPTGIFINFTYPLEKTIYPQIYPKTTKEFIKKKPETRYEARYVICHLGMEISDCLKRERDICVKAIKSSQNTAVRSSPALTRPMGPSLRKRAILKRE